MNSDKQSMERAKRPGGNYWIVGVVVLIAVLFLIMKWQQTQNPGATGHPAVGSELVGIQLDRLLPTGGTSIGADQLTGKIVLINYWGTWCPPCRLEMPHLVKLYEEFKTNPEFLMLSVTCPASEPADPDVLKEQTESFLESMEAELPVYVDLQTSSRRHLMSVARLDTFAYPTTVILDRQRKIRGMFVGYLPGDEKEMHRIVNALLNL